MPDAPHDIIVISDLHMGRGKNPDSRRYYTLEAFFYDEDFRAFCRFLRAQSRRLERPFKLIFNGDTFDLLRVESRAATAADSASVPLAGPVLTPRMAATLVEEILAGHPDVVDAIAEVLLSGNEVILLPGNHDVELQWPCVHAAVRKCVGERARHFSTGGDAADAAMARLDFRPWFYHEPNRVWIEHGCQYDPENSFRYFLRSDIESERDVVHLAEQDVPLGNFFQRYLYNEFGHITFIVPSARANGRYLRWLLINQPRIIFRVVWRHLPFAFQVLRRMGKTIERRALNAIKAAHQKQRDDLSERAGLGDKLRQIDDLKQKRADVIEATRTLAWQFLKLSAVVSSAALLSAGLWFIGFLSINDFEVGLGIKTLLFLSLNLFGVTAAVGLLAYAMLRSGPPKRLPLGRAAKEIAKILDVPIVTFGHTHDEMIYRIKPDSVGGAWYFNTGTWVAVFVHDVLLPRERVQYTFLRIRNNDAELLQWSPGRQEPLPVILLEERAAGLLTTSTEEPTTPQLARPS